MIGTHITKDKQVIPIGLMETEHIVNTINLFLKGLPNKIRILKNVDKIDPLQLELYTQGAVDPKSIAREIKEKIQKCYPYIAELAFRDEFHLVRKEFQVILQREGALYEKPSLLIEDGKIKVTKGGDALLKNSNGE